VINNGIKRLESACEKVLSFTPSPSPSYKNIDSILKSGQDKLVPPVEKPHAIDENYSFTRGAEYYGRKK
jgi:hypothetical protein